MARAGMATGTTGGGGAGRRNGAVRRSSTTGHVHAKSGVRYGRNENLLFAEYSHFDDLSFSVLQQVSRGQLNIA